jgi:hypothetical protein
VAVVVAPLTALVSVVLSYYFARKAEKLRLEASATVEAEWQRLDPASAFLQGWLQVETALRHSVAEELGESEAARPLSGKSWPNSATSSAGKRGELRRGPLVRLRENRWTG